jgi:hypothetical protein
VQYSIARRPRGRVGWASRTSSKLALAVHFPAAATGRAGYTSKHSSAKPTEWATTAATRDSRPCYREPISGPQRPADSAEVRPHERAGADRLARVTSLRILAKPVRPSWESRSALHNTALHNTALHNTALHNTALHNTARHNTALHNTAQYNTAQYNSVGRANQQRAGEWTPQRRKLSLSATEAKPSTARRNDAERVARSTAAVSLDQSSAETKCGAERDSRRPTRPSSGRDAETQRWPALPLFNSQLEPTNAVDNTVNARSGAAQTGCPPPRSQSYCPN